MTIHRNVFENLAEAQVAVTEFPVCGMCKAPVKIQQREGLTYAECAKRPGFASVGGVLLFKHVGIKRRDE